MLDLVVDIPPIMEDRDMQVDLYQESNFKIPLHVSFRYVQMDETDQSK